MTDKEATEIIKVARAEVEWEYPMEYTAAFDRAIEALEKCEKIGKIIDFCIELIKWEHDIAVALKELGYGLGKKLKTGHWIVTGDYDYYVECSCCHKYSPEIWNYCPHCGARMNGVEE